MKRFLIIMIGLLPCNILFAQKDIPDFGKIDKADLTSTSCTFEPSASAMELFDVQNVEFEVLDYSTKLVTEERVRIKIFNQSGYDYASIRIPYFMQKKVTKIKDLEGVVYSLDSNGQIVTQKLNKKDFFREKAEENVGIINFTFPNLKPGCVVEFRYTKVEKDIFQIDPWVLQGEIPVAYTSMTLTTPSFSNVKTKIYGADSIDRVTTKIKNDRSRTIYFRENIHSFEPEPFMSSYKDNLLKMVFLLIPKTSFIVNALTEPTVAWKYAGNTLLDSKDYGGQIENKITGTESIIDSAKKISLLAKRIGFIYEAVKKQIPNKTEQTLYPDDLQETWNNRVGNTAEINLILVNLLQKADVPCAPILISTRENGKVNTDFPSIGQMNGVDALAEDSNTYYLMDASLKYQSYLNPPFNVLNRLGYLLARGNMQWVKIENKKPLVNQTISIVGQFHENGEINGQAICQYYDYAKSYALDSTTEDDPGEKFEEKKPIGLKFDSVKVENAENDDEPLLQKIYFSYELSNSGNYYFINPQILTSKKENPFIKETRMSDIDFGCNQQQLLTLQVKIPPSFEIDHLPKNIVVRAPDSSFFYKRIFLSDSEHIYMSQQFEIMRPIFDKEDYSGVKEFFDRVYQLMNEEIILKRKE